MTRKIKTDLDIDIKPYYVRKMLIEDMGLVYRSINCLAKNTNIEKSKILRQLFCVKYLKTLETSPVIGSYDECTFS